MATEMSRENMKLMQTASNEVFFPRDQDYNTWCKDVTDYIVKKTEFQGKADPYKKVDHKSIQERQTRYNPITQVYTDTNRETVARRHEQEQFINQLAKNKDRALRYEQTYNVLNFQNKLTGLENRPDYPKEKPWYFRPERDSCTTYNIVSNMDLKEHYFDAPEKRPEPDVEKVSRSVK